MPTERFGLRLVQGFLGKRLLNRIRYAVYELGVCLLKGGISSMLRSTNLYDSTRSPCRLWLHIIRLASPERW